MPVDPSGQFIFGKAACIVADNESRKAGACGIKKPLLVTGTAFLRGACNFLLITSLQHYTTYMKASIIRTQVKNERLGLK